MSVSMNKDVGSNKMSWLQTSGVEIAAKEQLVENEALLVACAATFASSLQM